MKNKRNKQKTIANEYRQKLTKEKRIKSKQCIKN